MRVLALDPGAKRLGWAIISGGGENPVYIASGILASERAEGESYQDYRLRVMNAAVSWIEEQLACFMIHEVVMEIVPVKGFNDMGQAYLALSVISAITGVCMTQGYKVQQIGATTVKARVGGTKKATKVRLRNVVWQYFPQLRKKAPEWKKVFDESDAIAIALAHLGYTKPK